MDGKRVFCGARYGGSLPTRSGHFFACVAWGRIKHLGERTDLTVTIYRYTHERTAHDIPLVAKARGNFGKH